MKQDNHNDDCHSELSHHYGIEKIEKFGACLITIINGQYCKKLVCLLKDQFHQKQTLKKLKHFIFFMKLKTKKRKSHIIYHQEIR